jgi:hypothetical protein
MGGVGRFVPIVMAIALVVYPAAGAEKGAVSKPEKPEKSGKEPSRIETDLVFKPPTLKGKVTDTAGKAVGKTDIRLLAENDKIVSSARTDKDGQFTLAMASGKYTLAVGDKYRLGVAASEESEVMEVAVVIRKKTRRDVLKEPQGPGEPEKPEKPEKSEKPEKPEEDEDEEIMELGPKIPAEAVPGAMGDVAAVTEGGLSTTTWIVIGATAVVVPVAVLALSDDDDDDKTVSP